MERLQDAEETHRHLAVVKSSHSRLTLERYIRQQLSHRQSLFRLVIYRHDADHLRGYFFPTGRQGATLDMTIRGNRVEVAALSPNNPIRRQK